MYSVIRRTNKISPVKAISTRITSSRKKLKKSLIKNSGDAVMAFNSCKNNMKFSISNGRNPISSKEVSAYRIYVNLKDNYGTSKKQSLIKWK